MVCTDYPKAFSFYKRVASAVRLGMPLSDPLKLCTVQYSPTRGIQSLCLFGPLTHPCSRLAVSKAPLPEGASHCNRQRLRLARIASCIWRLAWLHSRPLSPHKVRADAVRSLPQKIFHLRYLPRSTVSRLPVFLFVHIV